MDTDNNVHSVAVSSGTLIMIDVSKYNFPNEIWYRVPDSEWITKVATFIPVILFGLIGNALLVYIILRNRSLRTPTNLLIANMAIADFATLLICPILVMYREFYQTYVLGPVGCKAEGYLQASLLITAVLSLCAVSYDRLTAIVLPQETRLTMNGTKLVILCTWVLGAAISVPLIIFRNYRERQWKNFLESYCSENIYVLPMYWHVLISAIVWFPLGIMVICYSAIFLKLDRYEAKVLRQENPISVSYKTKVAKMMFAVVIVFVIFRVPFTTLIFIRNEMLKDTKVNQVQGAFSNLWYWSHYLMFCNAAINPIIYGLTNDNFRKAFRKTPFMKLCRKGQQNGVKEKQQRIKNMLIGQPEENVKTHQPGQENTPAYSSSSSIWYTKKAGIRPRSMSTNLPDDSACDPNDYDVMENSVSQVEGGEDHDRDSKNGKDSPKIQKQEIGEENFI